MKRFYAEALQPCPHREQAGLIFCFFCIKTKEKESYDLFCCVVLYWKNQVVNSHDAEFIEKILFNTLCTI